MGPEAGSSVPPVLFLHGGPGLNARLERAEYGDSLPVHWWDQPHLGTDVRDSYAHLLDAAQQELQRLVQPRGTPVALLASSFGARLALDLIKRSPGNVAHLGIVGGILDVRTALVRLGNRIAEANGDTQLAEASLEAARSTRSVLVWALSERLFSVPNLLDFYWSGSATRQRNAMKALAAEGQLLDVPTYRAVLADLLARTGPPPISCWRGRVRVIIGRFDPYALAGDEQAWQAVFPTASIEWVKAGHFPHLELPSSAWLPPI